jgi:hypothetical protein
MSLTNVSETLIGTTGNATDAATMMLANRNGAASTADGSSDDVAYLIVMGLFAFGALQLGLALRELGAARPHATHELLKKYVTIDIIPI